MRKQQRSSFFFFGGGLLVEWAVRLLAPFFFNTLGVHLGVAQARGISQPGGWVHVKKHQGPGIAEKVSRKEMAPMVVGKMPARTRVCKIKTACNVARLQYAIACCVQNGRGNRQYGAKCHA